MEKRVILVLLIFSLIGIAILLLIVVLQMQPGTVIERPTPIQTAPEGSVCQEVYVPNNGGINIVFLGQKAQAKEYADYLLSIEPFKSNTDKFNVYAIENVDVPCQLYKGTVLLCYDKETIKKASVCPNDYIVVLKDENEDIRSSSYLNVMSLNTKLPASVFAHEFGHAFAFLSDEYTPATPSKKNKNCVETCTQFTGNNEGCFPGCAENSLYRSVDEGLMRTLSADTFGVFDEGIIREFMPESKNMITGNAVKETVNCSEQNSLLLEISNKDGQRLIKSVTPYIGCISTLAHRASDWTIKGKSNEGDLKTQTSFDDSLLFFDGQKNTEQTITGGAEESNQSTFVAIMSQDVSRVEVVDKYGQTVDEKNLSKRVSEEPLQNPLSELLNNGTATISGILSIVLQKKVAYNTYQTLDRQYFENYTFQLKPNESMRLGTVFNPLNITLNESGNYRIVATITDKNYNQQNASWEFLVVN